MTTCINFLIRHCRMFTLAASALFLLTPIQPSIAEASASTAEQEQQLELNQELITKVQELLASASLSDRAWGAYLAQRNSLKQFTPNLIDVLRTLADDESPDAWLATSAVLDSLVQLEADVPPDVIMSETSRFTVEKVILLARSPLENKESLLDVMRNNSGVAWRAAGNLLAEVKAPGLGALLLRDLRISVAVLVVDPHSGGGISSGSSACGLSGLATIAVPQDYPPIGFYGLTEYPSRGLIVLAPGPKVVYYYRTVVKPGTRGAAAGNQPLYGRSEAVFEYLAMLLDTTPSQLGLKPEESYSEQWRGTAALKRRVGEIRAEVTAKYRSIASRLVEARLLAERESDDLLPHIEVHLADFRSDTSIPLPDLSH